jgi:EAL domain-containing protein (putative c-di-GMP-specific phosphodiesterase class I)
VNFAQGYLLGRPMPASQLEAHFEADYKRRDAA